MLAMVGNWEVFAILIVALLLFGSRLPSVMRSLGKSVSSFKQGLREVEDEMETQGENDQPRSSGGEPPSPAG
jgi:sec-independent protein translocase protein TatA